MPTIVPGVNDDDGRGAEIVSTASCTTNCIAPVTESYRRRSRQGDAWYGNEAGYAQQMVRSAAQMAGERTGSSI